MQGLHLEFWQPLAQSQELHTLYFISSAPYLVLVSEKKKPTNEAGHYSLRITIVLEPVLPAISFTLTVIELFPGLETGIVIRPSEVNVL